MSNHGRSQNNPTASGHSSTDVADRVRRVDVSHCKQSQVKGCEGQQAYSDGCCFTGSAIRCFSCKDYTASCSKQRDCSYDDACLTLNERGKTTPAACTPPQAVGWDESNPSSRIVLTFSGCPAGGMTYRQCLKYSDCEHNRLAQMFPQVTPPQHTHTNI